MTWKHTTHGRKASSKGKKTSTTHHGLAGMHGRSATHLAYAAKIDAWKHKGQARGQGNGGSGGKI